MATEFGPEYWEARYSGHAGHGSRPPSPHLVTGAAGLTAGTALDAGCGEGGNAVWLAEQGWQVTAVDVSVTALSAARELAEARGGEVAGRISWVEADLTRWVPPREAFDLVTAHYVHPAGSGPELLRRLALAVAPGGTLLVADHAPADEHAHAHASVDELRDCLPDEGWRVEVAETRVRRDTDGHDREVTLHDVVLLAHRTS